jgi:hypothetical protein
MKRSASALIKSEGREYSVEVISKTESKFVIVYKDPLKDIFSHHLLLDWSFITMVSPLNYAPICLIIVFLIGLSSFPSVIRLLEYTPIYFPVEDVVTCAGHKV